jgi:hypothetical protein
LLLADIPQDVALVAHNAGFDQSVLNACCQYYRLAPPQNEFICSIEAASSVWALKSYRLPRVCEFLCIPLKHHHAQSDAEASASILIKAVENGYDPFNDSAPSVSASTTRSLSAEVMRLISSVIKDGTVNGDEIRNVASWFKQHESAAAVWPGSEINQLVTTILEDGIIDEREVSEFRELCWMVTGMRERVRTVRRRAAPDAQVVCFTGFGPKKDAMRAEAEVAGFHVAGSITKKLKFLVCGPQPGPSKVSTARERGISVLSESQWHSVLKGEPVDQCPPTLH